MSYTVPSLKSTGMYELASPYCDFIPIDQRYTCQAIRLSNDFIAMNDDLYSVAYTPYGVTEDVYARDVEENVPIITLQDDNGVSYHIPASAILKKPLEDGVAYTTGVIAVNLGAMPVDYDYGLLTAEIKELVYYHTGINSTAAAIEASGRAIFDKPTHETLLRIRALNKQIRKPIQEELAELKKQCANAKETIGILEKYILRCVAGQDCGTVAVGAVLPEGTIQAARMEFLTENRYRTQVEKVVAENCRVE